ncbi:hypothetical protein OH77DRAFT_1391844, partial [Trametes cingulata]
MRCPRTAEQVRKAQERYRRLQSDQEGLSYLEIASDELRKAIIAEWQDMFQTRNMRLLVCAVCGKRTKPGDTNRVHASEVELSLLRNDDLPAHVLPTTYALDVYCGAILHPKGMADRSALGDLLICVTCDGELRVKKRMPKFALANWLYYGHEELPEDVRRAFADSTPFERILISRARASKVSFRFSEIKTHAMYGTDALTSQRCIKGNVVVMPQDATHLNELLPPSFDVLRDTVCAVFVGQSKPTRENIARLGPVLVRKSRVRLLIQFLLDNNVHYARNGEFLGFSQRNLDVLFGEDKVDEDQGVPCAMEIGFLQDCDALRGATSDYTGRDTVGVGPATSDELIMENVGYTECDDTPQTYRQMKMKALSHCLTGGRFVRSQAGSRFVPDFKNPRLLSWLFPHLDPWGIGGFFEPARKVPLTLEEQLAHLLQIEGAPFVRDADFAFVYYNICQKKAVCDSVNFRVRASQQEEIVRRLMHVDVSVLQNLIERYERDPQYQPQTEKENTIVRLLNEVSMIGRDLPGTAAYKKTMRNEIRSLIYFKGTPALFVTLNPSDVHHPLVRLYAGENITLERMEHGQELTEWQRKVLVAKNPGPCAMFFHTMMSAFIRVILRYGRPGRGLFG